MTRPRKLLSVVLLLAFAAAPLAQPDSAQAPSGANETARETATSSTADEKGDQVQDSSPARNESPFVYRPSEEISEDLPVSFPVDI